MYTIATLHHLREFLGIDPGVDDARLLDALGSATAQIERLAGRRFLPYAADRPHDIDPDQRDYLPLDDDLVRLDALTNGDGGSIPLADVQLIQAGGGPVMALRLLNGQIFIYDQTPAQAVSVSGIWGWHDRPDQAWRSSGDSVQDDPLLAAATSLSVTDADGADPEGITPRFQVGQLLRIEDEMAWVLAVDTLTNSLTIGRGANGTTAADHAADTAIEIYTPPADVRMLALRWAGWLYRTPDHGAADVFPDGLREEVQALRRIRL